MSLPIMPLGLRSIRPIRTVLKINYRQAETQQHVQCCAVMLGINYFLQIFWPLSSWSVEATNKVWKIFHRKICSVLHFRSRSSCQLFSWRLFLNCGKNAFVGLCDFFFCSSSTWSGHWGQSMSRHTASLVTSSSYNTPMKWPHHKNGLPDNIP